MRPTLTEMGLTATGGFCRDRCESCKAAGRKGARGSATRKAMRFMALSVALEITGGRSVCLHCDAPISLTEGEVDRTAEGCYALGAFVMTCTNCNNALGQMQNGFDFAQYAADILTATMNCTFPPNAEMVREYDAASDLYNSIRKSRYHY